MCRRQKATGTAGVLGANFSRSGPGNGALCTGNQLKELCSARVIGGSLNPSALSAALQTDGLCGTPEVHAAGEKGGVIPCSTGAYLEVTAVEVTCYV